MYINVHVASAFSKNNFGGNKAGVVFSENELTIVQKKDIARQLGYAETAFVFTSNVADFRLEFFTPKEEVDLCGHATIATFVVLMKLNRLTKNQYKIETNSGVLTIDIKDKMIFMEQNTPVFYDQINSTELSGCFDVEAINREHPVEIVSTGLKDILVPIKTDSLLSKIKPNFEKIKQISKKYDVIGMHLFTVHDSQIVCRNFAPLYDIDEESATGTSNCALAGYLYTHAYLQKELYVFNQGYSLNEPSEIFVNLETDQRKRIQNIYAGGRGYYIEIKTLLE